MTDNQVKIINEKMHIIEPCVKFACDFLILPDIEVRFEDCPSARFPSMNNAAESGLRSDGQGLILINGPWFADRVNDHQDDIEFFIFHELRHLHQQKQIQLMDSGERTRETLDIIKNGKIIFIIISEMREKTLSWLISVKKSKLMRTHMVSLWKCFIVMVGNRC